MPNLFNENFLSYRQRQEMLSYDDHVEVNKILYEMSLAEKERSPKHQEAKEKYSQMIMSILSKYEPSTDISPRTGLQKSQGQDELGGWTPMPSRYQPTEAEQNKKYNN